MSFAEKFIGYALKEFRRYESLGDRAFEQLDDEQIQWRPNPESNSVALIVKHMVGNMRSRFTGFLTEDGEKAWRNRDSEFEDPYVSKAEMENAWKEGWQCVYDALNQVNESNFDNPVFIRKEPHHIMEAVNRQIAHYASHVGQILFIAKALLDNEWESLSIPKGKSREFNKKMFGK